MGITYMPWMKDISMKGWCIEEKSSSISCE